jgi:hypothetical protein
VASNQKGAAMIHINTVQIDKKQKLFVVTDPETFIPAINELIGYANYNDDRAVKYCLQAMIESIECVDTEVTATDLIVKREIDEEQTVDVLYEIESR